MAKNNYPHFKYVSRSSVNKICNVIKGTAYGYMALGIIGAYVSSIIVPEQNDQVCAQPNNINRRHHHNHGGRKHNNRQNNHYDNHADN